MEVMSFFPLFSAYHSLIGNKGKIGREPRRLTQASLQTLYHKKTSLRRARAMPSTAGATSVFFRQETSRECSVLLFGEKNTNGRRFQEHLYQCSLFCAD